MYMLCLVSSGASVLRVFNITGCVLHVRVFKIKGCVLRVFNVKGCVLRVFNVKAYVLRVFNVRACVLLHLTVVGRLCITLDTLVRLLTGSRRLAGGGALRAGHFIFYRSSLRSDRFRS